MSFLLYVGDCTEEVAISCQKQHPNAFLVEFSNYQQVMQDIAKGYNIVAYTSFADLPKIEENTNSVFYNLLDLATEIFYIPPNKWSDHKEEYSIHSMQRITEYFLYNINNQKNNVHNLSLEHYQVNVPYLELKNKTVNHPTIYVAGCSISHGVGVKDTERYGEIVASNLGMQSCFLTDPGSSIEWAGDQILRSDIQSDDIVIWGLTSEYRACEWDTEKHKIKHINNYNFEGSESGSIALISEENRLYKALTVVHQVNNFCNKIGVQLICFPIISSEALKLYLSGLENFYDMPYKRNVDLGSDNVHPGPKQHQYWAKKLTKIITCV